MLIQLFKLTFIRLNKKILYNKFLSFVKQNIVNYKHYKKLIIVIYFLSHKKSLFTYFKCCDTIMLFIPFTKSL